jgi:hypothetical protein
MAQAWIFGPAAILPSPTYCHTFPVKVGSFGDDMDGNLSGRAGPQVEVTVFPKTRPIRHVDRPTESAESRAIAAAYRV